MRFTNAPRFSCGLNLSHGIRAYYIFLICRSIQCDLSYIFSGVPDKIELCFVEHLTNLFIISADRNGGYSHHDNTLQFISLEGKYGDLAESQGAL